MRLPIDWDERYTITEVEYMIAGRAKEHEHLRDLLTEHALRSTPGYEKGTTVASLLGREPEPIDPRWPEARKAAAAEARRTLHSGPPPMSAAEIALDQARAEAAVASGYGTMGRLSPEETAKLFAEAEAGWVTEGD